MWVPSKHYALTQCQVIQSLLFKPFADPYIWQHNHKDIVIHLGGTKLKYKIPNMLDDKHI
jgi:hypothetical protein